MYNIFLTEFFCLYTLEIKTKPFIPIFKVILSSINYTFSQPAECEPWNQKRALLGCRTVGPDLESTVNLNFFHNLKCLKDASRKQA